jgi:hypothetical protein
MIRSVAFDARRPRGIQFATKIPGREILCNGAPPKMAASVQAFPACRII